MFQFSNQTSVPDPVEGFTNITENGTNIFAFVQGLAKNVI